MKTIFEQIPSFSSVIIIISQESYIGSFCCQLIGSTVICRKKTKFYSLFSNKLIAITEKKLLIDFSTLSEVYYDKQCEILEYYMYTSNDAFYFYTSTINCLQTYTICLTYIPPSCLYVRIINTNEKVCYLLPLKCYF